MDVKTETKHRLDAVHPQLNALSHRIHGHPELGFEEEKACEWLSDLLSDGGFTVQTGFCELDTAFMATAGNGPLHVAICAEYDALPGIGHACGHNIIAAMSAGAGLALAKVADDVGLTVHVVGTPAEEVGDGGGKILLLERGGFAGVHAAMMVHPTPFDAIDPNLIACSSLDVTYTGKAAHASMHPELGVNAADALTIAQISIGLLRQHILPTERVHGIVTKGGDAANIVPAHTTARYLVRATDLEALAAIQQKVERCFEAGALATGATLGIVGGARPYAEVHHDLDISRVYQSNAEAVGRTWHTFHRSPSASTDMGNVSLRIPSIHPAIGIDSLPAVNHQPEFTAHCVTEAADRALRDGALAMAWTCIDLAAADDLRARLMAERRAW